MNEELKAFIIKENKAHDEMLKLGYEPLGRDYKNIFIYRDENGKKLECETHQECLNKIRTIKFV